MAARSYDNQWVTMEYSVANNRRVLHANQHMTGGLNGSRKYISTNALRNERERHEKNIQYQSRTEPTSIRAKLIIRRAHKDPFPSNEAFSLMVENMKKRKKGSPAMPTAKSVQMQQSEAAFSKRKQINDDKKEKQKGISIEIHLL